jgi:hypothetical protein
LEERLVGINERFDRIDRQLESISGRLDALLLALTYVGGGLIAALATAVAALIAT